MTSNDTETNRAIMVTRSRRKLWVGLACLVAIVAAGGYYWQFGGEQEVQDQPLIVTVEIGNIENTITAAGSLQPFEFVDVGAQVNGILESLLVEVGDQVEAGQLMAEIDARIQAARVDASQASIEALEAQIEARRASLALARANTDRQERLMQADATSQLDYDNAINNLASAQAGLIQLEKQILQSRASLESDATQLEFSRIYAPRAGTVVSIEMNEGRTINANQQAPTILRIADLNTMTVETEISEADIGRIEKGMQVYFTTLGGGNRRWYSELRQILPTPVVENNVVLYTGLFDVDNSDGALLSDMTAQVYFVTSSANNVPTVPIGALTFIDQQPGQPRTAVAARPTGGAVAGGNGGAPQFAGSGQDGLTDEMRERLRERLATGQGVGGQGGFGAAAAARPGGAQDAPSRRLATVQVVRPDGSQEKREIIVGVTSRIAAEVISGLEVGEQVVAGILQAGIQAPAQQEGDDRREVFRAIGGFR